MQKSAYTANKLQHWKNYSLALVFFHCAKRYTKMERYKLFSNDQLTDLLTSYEQAYNAKIEIKEAEHGYFVYPVEITDFIKLLSNEPWVNHDYKPAELNAIRDSIETASFDEIRSILTGFMRSERFFNGSWKNSLNSNKLDPIFLRLKKLANV